MGMWELHNWIMRNDHNGYPRRGRRSDSSPVPGLPGHEGELWLDHGDSSGRGRRGGIKYYPETDSFHVPDDKGGPYDVHAEHWEKDYGDGDFWEEKERQLMELSEKGGIRGRKTNRFGEPWGGDRYGDSRGDPHGVPHGSPFRDPSGGPRGDVRYDGSRRGSIGDRGRHSEQGSRYGESHPRESQGMPPASRPPSPFGDVPRSDPPGSTLASGSRHASRFGRGPRRSRRSRRPTLAQTTYTY